MRARNRSVPYRRVVLTVFCVMLLGMGALSASAAELRVLSTRPQAELMDHINDVVIPAFEEKHGISVTFEFASWDERVDKLLISIAAGVPYDIVFTGFFSPYEEGSYNLITPLDGFLEQWEHYNKYPPGLWETQKWNGKTYSVPLEVQIRGIGYNRELFAQAGIGADQTPQSWEEQLEYTRTLTHMQDASVSQRGLLFSTAAAGGTSQHFFWWLKQAGVTETERETGASNLNHPVARETLAFMLDLYDASMIDLGGAGGGLAGGRVAMAELNPTSYYNAITADPDLVDILGVFAPKKSPDAVPVAHTFANGLAITEASNNKQAAWDFIAMMLDDDSLVQIQLATGWIGGRADLVMEVTELIPGIDRFLPLFEHVYASMVPPPRNRSQQELAAYLSQAFNREIPPEEALLHSHDVWVQLVSEWTDSLEQ